MTPGLAIKARAKLRASFYRNFHEYFVTHVPKATSHAPSTVRIPLRGAKQHFGVSVSRGTRPYNEDSFQAGVIDLPAFADRVPGMKPTATDKPQVFYFGVFDGHGGSECSGYLRERLHEDLEATARTYHLQSTLTVPASEELQVDNLLDDVLSSYKEHVGGYFQRFDPLHHLSRVIVPLPQYISPRRTPTTLLRVLVHTFLQTDLTFLLGQLRLRQFDDLPINHLDSMDIHPKDNESAAAAARHTAASLLQRRTSPFLGGSTASVALISTPTLVPFWHPTAPTATVITAHVGDTRILLCRVDDGAAQPLTTTHHPSTPSEATRLRRWSGCFLATDSFGEERMSGLANTRSFGDLRSKRLGVSAEPEIRITSLPPAAFSFMLMVSDGVSAVMSDQEMVDLVKEAPTPDAAARNLVAWATDVAVGEGDEGADNATALVIRLGGWERRQEGGRSSLGTREQRDWRKREAGEARSMARGR